jgi:hypothetical protein
MQVDHAGSTAMGRLMMTRVCKRESAEERERRGQCYRRKFHDLVVRVVCTNSKWTFYSIVPLKSSLSAMEASWWTFLRHERWRAAFGFSRRVGRGATGL